VTADGTHVALHHRVDGDPTAPAVVLGPSIGTTLAMWEPQVEALAQRWRVVRFDTRGHGGSPVTKGPYTVEDLADDVLALVDELGVDQFAYAGNSLGGTIGQQLAADHPDRVRSLVLCCTAAKIGESTGWHERAERVRAEGTDWLVDVSRDRWFHPDFQARSPQQVDALLTGLRETPVEGYAACCEALAEFDGRSRLEEIQAPTLVVAGESDPATPPDRGAEMTDGIPDSELLVVARAAHLAGVERPDVVTPAIVRHLERTAP
jgi:3-oxoadipate enol-lactonase